MKTALSLILLLAVFGGGFLYMQQRRDKTARAKQSAWEETMQALAAGKQAADEAARRSERELQFAHAQLNENAAQLALLRQRGTAEPEPAGAPSAEQPGSEPLIQDAETRALMRQQQLKQVRRQVERFVNDDLAAVLGLDATQKEHLRELVLQKHSGHAEFMASLLSGELRGEALRDAGARVNAQLRSAEQLLQQFLGPDGYSRFVEEENAEEPRRRIKRIAEALQKSGQEMSDEQHQQFLAATVADHRESALSDLGNPMGIDFEYFHDHFSEANLDRHFRELQQHHARVLESAATYLSPAQIQEIGTWQQEQLDQAKVTTKLTTALLQQRRRN